MALTKTIAKLLSRDKGSPGAAKIERAAQVCHRTWPSCRLVRTGPANQCARRADQRISAGRVAEPRLWAPTGQFDEEERLNSFEQHGVDGEEVAGQDRVGLAGEELAPGRPGTSWRRIDASPVEDLPHGAGGDSVAQNLRRTDGVPGHAKVLAPSGNEFCPTRDG